MIATITAERNISLFQLTNQSYNAEAFIRFLRELRRKWGKTPLALMLDNAGYHKGLAMPYYDKYDITPIWNVGYSPEFNPIGKCRSLLS